MHAALRGCKGVRRALQDQVAVTRELAFIGHGVWDGEIGWQIGLRREGNRLWRVLQWRAKLDEIWLTRVQRPDQAARNMLAVAALARSTRDQPYLRPRIRRCGSDGGGFQRLSSRWLRGTETGLSVTGPSA
jgi:hypothetical protein